MNFKQVQQEVRSNDDLCLFLKYPLRLSSVSLIGFSFLQVFMIESQNIQFQSYIYGISLITQLSICALAVLGLLYSFRVSFMFKLQMHQLQQSNSSFYDAGDDRMARILFILNSLTMAIVISLAVINPIVYNVGLQTKIAAMHPSSYSDVLHFQQDVDQSNPAIFASISFLQLLAILFSCYVYLLFCQNSTTYYLYIYIFALVAGFISAKIFSSRNIIHSINKVHYIPPMDHGVLIEFLVAASLALSLIILFLFALDFVGSYYRSVKSPLYKFFIGQLSFTTSRNIFIGLAFAFTGTDGQLIRNLSVYQNLYQSQQGCRSYMQLVPEIKLSEFGCISKYLKEPSCPKEQQTWRWEASGEELGCLNWNCCGLITQILLHDYIAFCMEVNLIAVLLTMLAIMLFQIRQLEDHALAQSLKQAALIFQACMILGGIVAATIYSGVDVYRSTYVRPEDYVSVDNVHQMQPSPGLLKIQHFPQQCTQHIPVSLVEQIEQLCLNDCGEVEVIVKIREGQFLLGSLNVETLKVAQEPNLIYLSGNGQLIAGVLSTQLQLCISSISSEVQWSINKHLQQVSVDNTFKYVHINVRASGEGTLKLFNTLLLDCRDYNAVKYKEMKVEEGTGWHRFYNYPIGIYGTIVYEQESISNCVYFNANREYFVAVPNVKNTQQLLVLLQWFGSNDLDLVVENEYCKVGAKYQNFCGGMRISRDATVGNQQADEMVSEGESIGIDFLGKTDYNVYVTKTDSSTYLASNAMVQIFAKSSTQPQISVSVKQIMLTGTQASSQRWMIAQIKQGQQIVVINKLL